MGRPRGFIEIRRAKAAARAASERVRDWSEFEGDLVEGAIREQGVRCMDCGIPFCHAACPLGNVIPAWNELVSQGRWGEAFEALDATNNFPEVTGRVCPAPCEASCVLNLESIPGEDDRRAAPGAVTIKQIERQVADRAFELDLARPRPASVRTGRRVAVVGSGPAGLACAQELARKGHDVTVFEKDDRIGGLLRYGIPDFKLDKAVIDRRVEQMAAEGVSFRTRVHVGVGVTGAQLRSQFDAVVLCGGAMVARPLDLAEPYLRGVHYAMDFLTQQNRVVARESGDALAGDDIAEGARITATGRDVVILGGGDTGSDCVGTSLRQGARSVTSFELTPRPPDLRAADNPWPAWPLVFRTSSSHEEGGARDFGVMTTRVLGDDRGRVRALEAVRVERKDGRLAPIEGSRFEVPCDLLLLAMGFVGSRREGLLEQLGVAMDARGNVATTDGATSVEGVFAAGDMARGQSLVVWAIAEGRKAAERVDAWLTSHDRFRNTAP